MIGVGASFRTGVYLRRALFRMKLTLRIDLIECLSNWWSDVSFAAHNYAKGKTGSTLSMGKGSIIIMSKKKSAPKV